MRKGLFKNLALAAPLVVCLPLGVLGADGAASGDEPSAKIFEDYSLTSATESADSKVVNPTAMTTDASAPCVGAQPQPAAAPCAQAPCGSGACPAPPNCCNTFGEPFCEPKCIFNAGVEATIFQVQTRGMQVDSFVRSIPAGDSFQQGNSQVFDQITFSPRIWAGVQEDCWGIEGRFWYMSDSTNRLDPFVALPPFTGQYTDDRVKAYTVDLEGTYSTCWCGNKLTGFLGARYASFEAGQGVEINRQVSLTETFETSAFSKFTFNGVGITTGFIGRTPLCCDGCINLVYGVRGSVLWGDSEGTVQTQATDINATGAATGINSAIGDNDFTTAFIVEALVGVEWDHELKCLPMCAFLRLGLEYQFWDMGDKASASSTTFAASNTGGIARSSASVGDVDTNMWGLTVSTGFTW
jgi:hypothetical protein